MNNFNFIQWLSVKGLIAAMFWALRQESRHDRKQMFELWQENQGHWTNLLQSFCDFKNVTLERFSKIKNREKQ